MTGGKQDAECVEVRVSPYEERYDERDILCAGEPTLQGLQIDSAVLGGVDRQETPEKRGTVHKVFPRL